jgi:Zn-dependent protease
MHGYSAYRLGDDTARLQGRLTMNPLAHLDPIGTLMMLFVGFGWAKPTPVNYGKLTRLKNRSNSIRIVSVAGVTANFLSALVAYFLRGVLLIIFFKSGLFSEGDAVLKIGNIIYFKSLLLNEGDSVIRLIGIIVNLLEYFYLFNLLLMAFNLLPFPPLDGYHIVETFIPYKYKTQFQQYERYFSMGLLALIVIGLITGSSPLYWIVEKIMFPFAYIITAPLNLLIELFFGI